MLKKFLVFLSLSFILTLCGCMGGGGDEDEFIITGIAAQGAPIANSQVEIKTQNGVLFETTTDEVGRYELSEQQETDNFIARVTLANGDFFYSIGFPDQNDIVLNIHPFTDIIVRNWFSVNQIDIDSFFSNSTTETAFPSRDDITAITNEIDNIIALTLTLFVDAADFNLFNTEFVADSTGFDQFLDFSDVTIIDGQLYFSAISISNSIESALITNLPIDSDLTIASDNAPSQPQNIRGGVSVVQNDLGEIIVAWEPSEDDIGLTGYRVFRNNEFVGETPYPVFIDSDLPLGEVYQYSVVAFDGRGQESQESDLSAPISLLLPDTNPPEMPFNLELAEQNGAIELTWTQNNIGDVFGFRIIRNNDQQHAIVSGTQFIDTDVIENTIYCYTLVAFDAAGNESLESETVCIQLGEELASQVSFIASETQVIESAGLARITVARLGNPSEMASVTYNVMEGTASANQDFDPVSGVITWQAGEFDARMIEIPILFDETLEEDETFIVQLIQTSSTISLGNNTQIEVAIIDVDTSCIEFSQSTITSNTEISEGCHFVNSNIQVSNGAILTLEPGVILSFAPGIGLSVTDTAALNALGGIDQPIIFTARIKQQPWNGIEISSSGENLLRHVVVEYGGQENSDTPANISITNGGVVAITNSQIRHSESYGLLIGADEDLVEFSNNTISNNNFAIMLDIDDVGKLTPDNIFNSDSASDSSMQDFIWVSGAQSETDQTWFLHDLPYRFIGGPDIRIENALTIEPSVQMYFDQGVGMSFRQPLTAVGSEDARILFTAAFDESLPTPGFWNGISFLWGTHFHQLSYADIEYGGANLGGEAAVTMGGQITVDLSNTTIQFSASFGLRHSLRAKLNMDNVSITNNSKAVLTSFGEVGDFTANNIYTGNDEDGILIRGNLIDMDATINQVDTFYQLTEFSNPIQVQANLTLNPGVEIRLDFNTSLEILEAGSLTAIGEEINPILITGNQRQPGFWAGINFLGSDSDQNIFEHVIIENGGSTETGVEALVAFRNTETSVSRGTISGSTLRRSSTNGILIEAGSNFLQETPNVFDQIVGENVLDGN